MPDPAVLQRLVSDVARQIRVRRAVLRPSRIVHWHLAALLPCLKNSWVRWALRSRRPPAVGLLAGVLYGVFLKLPQDEVARITTVAGLHDRIATALEWAHRPDRTAIVDARRRCRVSCRAPPEAPHPRHLPRETRFVPLPILAGVLLAVTPPIPFRRPGLPNFSVSREEEEEKAVMCRHTRDSRATEGAQERSHSACGTAGAEPRAAHGRSRPGQPGTSRPLQDTSLGERRPTSAHS
jgi:hypothetical protein